MKMSYTYDVREIDAWNGPDGWWYNAVYNMGSFTTKAKDERKAFMSFLRRKGVVFKKNRTLIEFDGDNYTVIDRKTKEPLFDAVLRGMW